MFDKIFALKANYNAEIEKLKVKIEVLDDLAALMDVEPVVEPIETVDLEDTGKVETTDPVVAIDELTNL